MSRKATPGSFQKGDARAGRKKGALGKATVEIRELARELTTGNPEYMAGLRRRLKAGKLAPAVESLLFHYGWGKPKEQVEVTGADGGALITEVRRVIVDAKDE